ncbi:volume-regulated anion channel subunit LRRC8B-like [Actinia tenebrosa]|uniref:Volume-regulated anion channel subunit LRRC8B-like n=1 Tax=Actinia tenebrosa TaxID=6105 RepID=A0A6P8J671_ACTTE|nr:volume-regulated anion channel subunit LRRC8B-like [Actinia tenebrosa]XP_031575249.1 volume-regulated anion channel subunit LRRC8B-like [Actinia tenebrosa]
MIVTDAPTLDENLKKVTPWWDVVSKYLIAAMMAIALWSIAIQVTKDNLICVPAIDCSKLTVPNGSLAANVSDAAKLCQSLKPKSLKKKVLGKMTDRRFYDYVDSVCFQKLSWFTKFFPLILLGETLLLLAFDIMWTKLPCFSSVLNHFVALADEGYSSLATIDRIKRYPKGESPKQENNHGEEAVSSVTSRSGDNSDKDILLEDVSTKQGVKKAVPGSSASSLKDDSSSSQPSTNQGYISIPDADALKLLNLVEKAEVFRMKYDQDSSKYLFFSYSILTFFQMLTCLLSLIFNLLDPETFFQGLMTNNTVDFTCMIDEFVFSKEYDYFECSHPLAPYFQVTLILFLISLFVHLVISSWAMYKICRCGRSYSFSESNEQDKQITHNDFAFVFFLLTQHDKLFADRVSYFFKPGTNADLPGNIFNYMSRKSDYQ